MDNLEYFINDRTKVLFILKEHSIEIDGVEICPLNQVEIAKNLGCSKVKANTLLRELINDGYIEAPQKGRYILTPSAITIIKKLEIGETL